MQRPSVESPRMPTAMTSTSRARPWVMRMTWRHLLFMHWPVDPDRLRPHVPPGLDIDTHDGAAWLGIVPFLMTGVRARCLPPLPTAHAFPELNVRTYVTPRADPVPGVWFFSLDAASALAVAGARATFHLPYFNARMSCIKDNTRIRYRSERIHPGAPPATFEAEYEPTAPATPSRPASIEHFLTERYCLYAADKAARLHRGRILHDPWRLAPARADVARCDMTALLDLPTPASNPLLHFADAIRVVAWPLQRVRQPVR